MILHIKLSLFNLLLIGSRLLHFLFLVNKNLLFFIKMKVYRIPRDAVTLSPIT